MKRPLVIVIYVMCIAGFFWSLDPLGPPGKVMAHTAAEGMVRRHIEMSSATPSEIAAMTETLAGAMDALYRKHAYERRISERRIGICFAYLLVITGALGLMFRTKK